MSTGKTSLLDTADDLPASFMYQVLSNLLSMIPLYFASSILPHLQPMLTCSLALYILFLTSLRGENADGKLFLIK